MAGAILGRAHGGVEMLIVATGRIMVVAVLTRTPGVLVVFGEMNVRLKAAAGGENTTSGEASTGPPTDEGQPNAGKSWMGLMVGLRLG